MAARRLFEHENDVHLCLFWILQIWLDSVEIWYADVWGRAHQAMDIGSKAGGKHNTNAVVG